MLSACAVGPDYHAPKVTLPETFDAAASLKSSGANGVSPGAAKGGGVSPVDVSVWWRSFGDPELDSLVERAIRSNPDVEIALDRLQEARTQEAVILGYALPHVGASAAQGFGTGSDVTRGLCGPTAARCDRQQRRQFHSTGGRFRRGLGDRPLRKIQA